MTAKRIWALAIGAALAAALHTQDARAGGLYFTERGVRPLGRGGAFVAGADDLSSVWMNPAGLADAKTSIMLDLSMHIYSADFSRKTNVTDASGAVQTVTFPTASGSGSAIPIPFVGGSLNFGENKEFTAALALFAPNVPLATWPESGAQRYTITSLDESALLVLGGYFAWKPVEEIRIGAGVQAMLGAFVAKTYFNANPQDRLTGAAEDPSYDAYARLSAPVFSPSANLGVTVVPDEKVRFGLSAQLPFAVDSSGTLQVRMPTAAMFDNARQEGQDVNVKFNLPFILRAGLEFRPDDRWRIEAAYVREFWSTHRSIDITPENIHFVNVVGLPSPFNVAPISLPKRFEDTHSFRLGAEAKFPLKESENAASARLGVMYEPSAVPPDYVSAVTIDMDKLIVGLGGSFHIGENWRLDALLAHAFTSDLEVNPATAKVPRVNPVKGNPTETEAVNGGTYSVSATLVGLGANYRF